MNFGNGSLLQRTQWKIFTKMLEMPCLSYLFIELTGKFVVSIAAYLNIVSCFYLFMVVCTETQTLLYILCVTHHRFCFFFFLVCV